MNVNEVKNTFSVLIFLLFSVLVVAQSSFVYISAQGSNFISVYSMNESNGSLTKVEDKDVAGGPASIAISPDKKFMYVSQRTNKTFSSYSIDITTGKLTLIGTIAAVDNPVNISTDNTGKYLLSAYFAANKAAIYTINPTTGVINPTPLSSFTTAGINPHAIKTDPGNNFLYITNMTGNLIQQFSFNEATGDISALNPAIVLPENTDGPRHFVFHNSKNLLYASNELSNTITVYNFDSSTGLLLPLQTISSLPTGYTLTNKVADIHITPDNMFLYASNRGYDSVAGFIIDPSTGLLTSNGFYPTQTSPRAFDIDETGSFLFAAGETSGKLSNYKINKVTGVLDSIGAYTIGSNPSWVRCLNTSITSSYNPEKNQTLFYPNPTNKGIYVNTSGDISVFSISGQKLLRQKMDGNSYLALSEFKNGVYIVKIETALNTFQEKLIKN
ncbi:MAG: beta-propeller fold lactonase family protein [Paludibacter sp.]|nr:beta-propeller fold lactonase family protein [Paludibacter sp.]